MEGIIVHNHRVVGHQRSFNVVVGRFSATATVDIGMDVGAAVSAAYRQDAPFAFTGTIKQVLIEISRCYEVESNADSSIALLSSRLLKITLLADPMENIIASFTVDFSLALIGFT